MSELEPDVKCEVAGCPCTCKTCTCKPLNKETAAVVEEFSHREKGVQ